jgi:hypothetical protein
LAEGGAFSDFRGDISMEKKSHLGYFTRVLTALPALVVFIRSLKLLAKTDVSPPAI